MQSEIDKYFYGDGNSIPNSIDFSLKLNYIIGGLKFLSKVSDGKLRRVCKLCRPGTDKLYAFIREHADELLDELLNNDSVYLDFLKYASDNKMISGVSDTVQKIEDSIGKSLIDDYIKIN